MRSEIVQLWFDCLTVVCFKYRDLSGNRQEIRVPTITKGIYSGTPFRSFKVAFWGYNSIDALEQAKAVVGEFPGKQRLGGPLAQVEYSLLRFEERDVLFRDYRGATSARGSAFIHRLSLKHFAQMSTPSDIFIGSASA